MTTALIFAGGVGRRMSARSKPKQFLELHGKPIIIYTLEHFEYHEDIDNIVIVCVRDWIEELMGLLRRFGILKVKEIVPGAETGHDSIFLGLESMEGFRGEGDIVLIHDGVRSLVTDDLITRNIEAVKKFGSTITAEAATESVIRCEDGESICEVRYRQGGRCTSRKHLSPFLGRYSGYIRERRKKGKNHRLFPPLQPVWGNDAHSAQYEE